MKLLSLCLFIVLLASCSQVRTARLSSGKIVKMTSADYGMMDALRYGNYVWIDTAGQKQPYPLVGYREVSEPQYLGRAIQVEVLNKID